MMSSADNFPIGKLYRKLARRGQSIDAAERRLWQSSPVSGQAKKLAPFVAIASFKEARTASDVQFASIERPAATISEI